MERGISYNVLHMTEYMSIVESHGENQNNLLAKYNEQIQTLAHKNRM